MIGVMTIAGRFDETMAAIDDPALAGPELLPERLALACARMLPVSGAGLSVADAAGQRIPLGASSPEAACAERLQFTAGDGPCTTTQASREPVFAVMDDLHRRWPTFAELLATRTEYRGVVALPLGEAIAGLGAIDLYFEREQDMPALDVFEAIALGGLVTSALSEASVWSDWAAERGPDWLHGPAATQRAAVWEAMGKVSLALEVEAPAALALMRAAARSSGRTVDEVAADLLTARLAADALPALG
jgi:hypothetical protein